MLPQKLLCWVLWIYLTWPLQAENQTVRIAKLTTPGGYAPLC
jgi:hypothetical protein